MCRSKSTLQGAHAGLHKLLQVPILDACHQGFCAIVYQTLEVHCIVIAGR